MAGITSRIVHHGLGVAGDRRQDDARVIGERLDLVLQESRFRANLARFRTLYEAYATNHVAERAVEAILDVNRTRRSD
jgi:hypothetical protein